VVEGIDSYAILKYESDGLSLTYFLLLLLLLNLIINTYFGDSVFLTKAKLGNPIPSGQN
jgi:hypothetical protein